MLRVLHLGPASRRLMVSRKQLTVEFNHPSTKKRTTPCEDLNTVVIDHNYELMASTKALNVLAENNINVVLCDAKHMPNAVLMSLTGTNASSQILRRQVELTIPQRKRAWQELVRAKIDGQAKNVSFDENCYRRLQILKQQVKSGDPTNIEAQAARRYWQTFLGSNFRRKSRSGQTINSALDYSYSLVRAALARSVVGVGLNAGISFHHSERINPFCLVDDLIEPLRPIIDSHVKNIDLAEESRLSPTNKKRLLEVLHVPILVGEKEFELAKGCDEYAYQVRGYVDGSLKMFATPKTTLIDD